MFICNKFISTSRLKKKKGFISTFLSASHDDNYVFGERLLLKCSLELKVHDALCHRAMRL